MAVKKSKKEVISELFGDENYCIWQTFDSGLSGFFSAVGEWHWAV